MNRNDDVDVGSDFSLALFFPAVTMNLYENHWEVFWQIAVSGVPFYTNLLNASRENVIGTSWHPCCTVDGPNSGLILNQAESDLCEFELAGAGSTNITG